MNFYKILKQEERKKRKEEERNISKTFEELLEEERRKEIELKEKAERKRARLWRKYTNKKTNRKLFKSLISQTLQTVVENSLIRIEANQVIQTIVENSLIRIEAKSLTEQIVQTVTRESLVDLEKKNLPLLKDYVPKRTNIPWELNIAERFREYRNEFLFPPPDFEEYEQQIYEYTHATESSECFECLFKNPYTSKLIPPIIIQGDHEFNPFKEWNRRAEETIERVRAKREYERQVRERIKREKERKEKERLEIEERNRKLEFERKKKEDLEAIEKYKSMSLDELKSIERSLRDDPFKNFFVYNYIEKLIQVISSNSGNHNFIHSVEIDYPRIRTTYTLIEESIIRNSIKIEKKKLEKLIIKKN